MGTRGDDLQQHSKRWQICIILNGMWWNLQALPRCIGVSRGPDGEVAATRSGFRYGPQGPDVGS